VYKKIHKLKKGCKLIKREKKREKRKERREKRTGDEIPIRG